MSKKPSAKPPKKAKPTNDTLINYYLVQEPDAWFLPGNNLLLPESCRPPLSEEQQRIKEHMQRLDDHVTGKKRISVKLGEFRAIYGSAE
jgi:hypothetical protein